MCLYSNIIFFGGNSEEETPVPIPNTEVKLFSADGTAWATAWESRSPPEFFLIPPANLLAGGFLCVGDSRFLEITYW